MTGDAVKDKNCKHPKCVPDWPGDDAVKGMDEHEIRRRWPRFEGVCPDCLERVIVYATAMQYIAGDY